MIIDLHCHTNCSDGKLSPTELINLAIENKLELLAITDHDCTNAYTEINKQINKLPNSLKLINGIEISTSWNGIGIHIVGLNIDINSKSILEAVSFQKQARIERTEKIIHKLAKKKIVIDYKTLIKQAGHDNIGRPHIAQYLVNNNYVVSVDKAFQKYLGTGKSANIKQCWADMEQIINWITNAGGIAIIAHPNKYKMTRTKQHYFIDSFIEMGGKGIEIISGRQPIDVTNKYIRLANDKGLLASVGSDFHKIAKYQPTLGINVKHIKVSNNIDFVWNNL